MIIRRRFLIVFAAFALLVVAPCPAPANSGDEGRFIESMAEKAIDLLTDLDRPRDERMTIFRGILNDHFAVEAIGRWVLGRYWNRATPEEKAEYLALFEDLIVVTYVDRFSEYAGEHLEIVGSETIGEADLMVHSLLKRPGDGQQVRVDWRVRAAGQGASYRIYDVIVEGVSMAQTQRSEFGSVISREGRSVAGLLDVLRRKTSDLGKTTR